jgi:acyl carrier protein
MNQQRVKDIVLNIISVIAPDAELAGLKSDQPLRDQLDLDSMDFLDIVMELRKRYKIEVPKEDYPQLASLDSCVSYLTPRLTADAVAGASPVQAD